MSVGHIERTAGSPERAVEAPARASRSGRVRQIDALRVLSCFSVIAVHAVGAPFPPDSVGLGETSFLLHYSREIFFFVSALVLVRTYYPRMTDAGRLPDEAGFRRRRMRLIGMPYLWWTALYFAVSIFHGRNTEPFSQVLDDLPLRWLYLVVTGNGSYHMYFLLVTLQYALAFPLVLRVLRRTQGHHWKILLGSLALQVLTLSVYQWWYLPDDGWRGILGDASLLAYQFWLVLGAIVGLHLHRCHDWVMAHRRWVLAAFPLAVVVLMWTYFAQLPGRGALGASSPLQPVMIVWSIAALGVLYLASVWIMERGSASVQAVFSYGAQLSFGVYLAHPMVLDVVLATLRRLGWAAPQVWVSLLTLALTTAGSVAVCAALHRTRLSLALMGRPKLDPERAPQLRWPRPRKATGTALFLTIGVLAVLLVGGDQSPPSESGTPSWEETVEASDPVQSPAFGDADDESVCGGELEAPHACPLAAEAQPGDGTSG